VESSPSIAEPADAAPSAVPRPIDAEPRAISDAISSPYIGSAAHSPIQSHLATGAPSAPRIAPAHDSAAAVLRSVSPQFSTALESSRRVVSSLAAPIARSGTAPAAPAAAGAMVQASVARPVQRQVATTPHGGSTSSPRHDEAGEAPPVASVAPTAHTPAHRPEMVHGPVPVQRFANQIGMAAGALESVGSQWGSGAASSLGEAGRNALGGAISHLNPFNPAAAAHGMAASRGGKPAAPPVDIHGVTEQVYQLLVKRLGSEKQRKGL
jgi:hypothetical protein